MINHNYIRKGYDETNLYLHILGYRGTHSGGMETCTPPLHKQAPGNPVSDPQEKRERRPNPVLAPVSGESASGSGEVTPIRTNPYRVLFACDYPDTPPDGAIQVTVAGKAGYIIKEWYSEMYYEERVAIRLLAPPKVLVKPKADVAGWTKPTAA